MKNIIFCIIILFSQSAFAQDYYWQVERVVDGDTIKVIIPELPENLQISIRIAGIDTPEKAPKAKCKKEAQLAALASEFTKSVIENANQGEISFSSIKWDKYGGRMLAVVKVRGFNLGNELIKNGLARQYHGEKKQGWCK